MATNPRRETPNTLQRCPLSPSEEYRVISKLATGRPAGEATQSLFPSECSPPVRLARKDSPPVPRLPSQNAGIPHRMQQGSCPRLARGGCASAHQSRDNHISFGPPE